jgi:hypothetical protein
MTQRPDTLDPKKYGLTRQTILNQDSPGRILICVDRASRIIIKDAKKIIEKARKIRSVEPDVQVVLHTSAPVCSKSARSLKAHQIDIETCS